MKKLCIALIVICLLVSSAIAEGSGAVELSGFMYGPLRETASLIGDMRWESDWQYANDIEQAYINDAITLAGNTGNEIKLIAIGDSCSYSLFGLQVGMNRAALEPLCDTNTHSVFEDEGEVNFIITLSEREDGFVETLWGSAEGDRLAYIVYEVGFGHGLFSY